MSADKKPERQTVLQERGERREEPQAELGPQLCLRLYRVLRSSRTFTRTHSQTLEAAREFCEWVNQCLAKGQSGQFSLQIAEHNLFLDGQLISIDERSRERGDILRKVFLERAVNQVILRSGISPAELLEFLEALEDSSRVTLTGFALASLELLLVDQKGEELEDDVDPRREVIEFYAALLLRCRTYFERTRTGMNASTREIKRVIQRIAERLETDEHIFVGLIHLRMLPGKDFVHAGNVALYSMVLARAVGLRLEELVRCGMTAIAQDIDKLNGVSTVGEMEVGDETHFNTNLTSVITLSQKGTRDVLSALRLVTNYERGFPYNRPMPTAWYEDQLSPHLLSRIIEIARDYDVLTQGFETIKPMTPDLALQALMEKMGSHYDPMLIKLFINTVGLYPAGCTVVLNDGRRALVIQSSSVTSDKGLSRATRPVLRILDGTEQIVDLKENSHSSLAIERIVDHDEAGARPSAFLLF